MKIIKQGNAKHKPKRFVCPECNCIFEADENEYSIWNAPMNETYFLTVCPCCGKHIYKEKYEDL